MKKLLVLLSFISLSFCGFLFAGCDPYSNMKINLSESTVVLSRSTDTDADVKTISATVKGVKGDISDEVVFISSKPEVVEVVKTTYADGTTKAELKAMGAGDAVVYAIAEGNVKKTITVKVEQNATGVGFTSNLSPVITRGEDFRFNDSYVSFQPANTTDKSYELKLLDQDGETVVYDMLSSNIIPASVTETLSASLYRLKLTKTVGEKTFTDTVSVNVLAKIDENKITIEQETGNGVWTKLNLADTLALSTNTELNTAKIRVKYNDSLISSIYTLDVSSTSGNVELYPSNAGEYIVNGFTSGLGKIVVRLSYAGFENFYSKSVELATDVKVYPESIKLNGYTTNVGLFSDNIFYGQNTKFVFTVSPAETSYKTLVLKFKTSDIGSKIRVLKQDGNSFVKEEGNELYNYLTAKEGFSYSDSNNEYTYVVFGSSSPIFIDALSTGGTIQAQVFNKDISTISADVLFTIRRPVTEIKFFEDQQLTESLTKVNLSEYQTRTIYFAYEPANAYFESLNFIADEEGIVSITKGSELINGTNYFKLTLTALNVGETIVKAYNGNNLIGDSSFNVTVFIPLEASGEDYKTYITTQTPQQNPLITAVNYSVNTASVSDIKINNSYSGYENPIEFYVSTQPYNATIKLDAEFELNGKVLEQTENDDGSIEVYEDLNGTAVCYFIYQKDTTNNTYKIFVQSSAYGNSFVIRFIISGYSISGEEIVVTRSVNATIYNQVDYNNIHVLRNGTTRVTSLTLKSSNTVGMDNLSEATSSLKVKIDNVVEGVNDYTVDAKLSGNARETSVNYAKVLSNDFVHVVQTGKGEYSVIAGDLGAYTQMRNVLTFEITEDDKTFYYPIEIWVTNNTLTSEINVLNANKADDGSNSFIRSYEVGTTYELQTLVLPRNADNQELEFVTSNENVFTVSDNGVVTFTGFGSAKLTILAKDSAHVSPENYINYITGLISLEEYENLVNYDVYLEIDVRVENGLDQAYSIYNTSDLNLLYKVENKYSRFIIESDITLSGAFGSVESFAGEFNGNGKTISNLTKPLFNTIELGGNVTNLKVNAVISSVDGDYVGVIARNNIGLITACVVDVVYGFDNFDGTVGGVAGQNRGQVRNNIVSIRMAGSASIAGGVVGKNYGTVEGNTVNFYGIVDSNVETAYVVNANTAGGVVGKNSLESGVNNSVIKNNVYSYVDDNFVTGTTIGVVVGINDPAISTNIADGEESGVGNNILHNFTGETALNSAGVKEIIKITEIDEINLSVKVNKDEINNYIAIYDNDLFASVVAGNYQFNLDTWFEEADTTLSEKYAVYRLKEYTYATYKVFSFTVYCKKNPTSQASYTAIISTEFEYSLFDASTGNKIDLSTLDGLNIRKGASKEFYITGSNIELKVSSQSNSFEVVDLNGGRFKVNHISGETGEINFEISRVFVINGNNHSVTLATKTVEIKAVSGIIDASFDVNEINFSKQDIAVITLSVTTDGEAPKATSKDPEEFSIHGSLNNQIKEQLGDEYTQGTVLDIIVKQTSSEIESTVTDEGGNVLTTFTKYYYTVQLFFNNSESLINVNYESLELNLSLLFNGYNELGEAVEIRPSLKVNILPQEVDNVQFAYYSSNQLNGQLVTVQSPQNVIVAGGSGLLEVYSYPYYADFDYATITSSSATTDDGFSFYLNFEQRFEKNNSKYDTAFNSGLYQSQDDYLRVNNIPYGTYLDKVSTCQVDGQNNLTSKSFNGFFYIWVVFDNIKANNLKDGTTFTISLTFFKQRNAEYKDFLTDEVIGQTYEFTLIYSRMPSAEVELADGGDVVVAGVDAELVITKGKPTDRDPQLTIKTIKPTDGSTSSNVSLVQKDGKWYIRTGIDLVSSNQSVSISIYITTQKVLGGIVETLTTEKVFTVVKFKILSIDFAENNLRKPTYESIALSYKITAKYFTVPNGYVATAVQQNYINAIKAEIAELEKMLTYSNFTQEQDGEVKVNSRYVTFANYADYQDKIGFILNQKLAVYALKDINEQITLNAQITVTYNSGSAVPSFVEPNVTNNRVESTLDQTFSANLVFSFYVDASEENPTPINTLDDFLAILSTNDNKVTEGHFRLNTNIYLTGWQADRSLNVQSFDGNGYVIYINNFNTSSSSDTTSLNLALFNEIGANTLVKNLIVCLPKGQTNIDVYDNINLTAFNFAGIAITNNGSIYNSEVLSLNINAFNVGTEEGVTYHNYFAGAVRPDTFRLEDYPHETHLMVETENNDVIVQTPATTTVSISTRPSVSLKVGLFATNNNGNILNSRVGRSITSVYGSEDIALSNDKTISTNIGYQYLRDRYSNVPVNKQVLDLSSYVQYGNGIQIVANGSVAGFVNVNNTEGLITNSYVANLAITNNYTTVSSAETAGFVATNYGTVMYSSVEGVASFTNADGQLTQDVQSVGSQIQGSGNIAGFVFQNAGEVSNSMSNIRINTNAISAGFVYRNFGSGTVSQSLSFSKNNTSAVNSPFAGHTGIKSLQEGTVENCFYFDYMQTLTSVSEDDSATPFSNDIESSKAENYAGFAINEVEKIKVEDGNDTYEEVSLRDVSYVWALRTLHHNSVEDREVKHPVIVSAHQIAVTHYDLRLGNTGNNSGRNFYVETSLQDAPILISSESEWNTRMVNNDFQATGIIYGNFRLIDHVDFSENAIVKTSSYYFAGNLDGNGLSLNNFALEGGGDFDGLFKGVISIDSFGKYTGGSDGYKEEMPYNVGEIREAVVKNVTLAPQRVKSNAASAGVLAGVIYNAKIYDIVVTNKNIKDDTSATIDPRILTAWFYAGGLAGVIYGDSAINNITSNVGVMSTSYIEEANKTSYYGDINTPLENLKFYVNKSASGTKVIAIFGDAETTFIATESVAPLLPHYAGGIAAVINVTTKESADDETIVKPNVERVKIDADSSFVSMAIHAGGVFGYVGEETYARDVAFLTQNANGARISGYRVLGGIAGVNKGTLQFARLLFTEDGDTSQLELDEELFTTPYTHNADFHLFEISTTTDQSYAVVYVGGVAGINIGDFEGSEYVSGVIVDSYSKVPIRPVFNQGTGVGYTFSYGNKVVVAGGIIGQMYSGTLRNAYVTGQVVANYSGGVIGIIATEAVNVKLENVIGMTNYVDKGWPTTGSDTVGTTYPDATRTTKYLTSRFEERDNYRRSTYRPAGIVSAFTAENSSNEIYIITSSALDGKTKVDGNFTINDLKFEAKGIEYNSLVVSSSNGEIKIPFVYSDITIEEEEVALEISDILNGLEDYFTPFNETDDGTWEYTGFTELKLLPYPTYGLVSTVGYIYDELTFNDICDYSEKSYYIDPTLSANWQRQYGVEGITRDNYFIEVNLTEENENGEIGSEEGWEPFHDGDFIGQLIGTRKIITENGQKVSIYPTIKIKLSTSFTKDNLNLGVFDTIKTATIRNLNFEIILEKSTEPTAQITGETAFGFLAARAIDSKISNVTINWVSSITSYSDGNFKNYDETARLTLTTAPANLNVNYFGGLVGYEQGCEIENTTVNYNGNKVNLYEPWNMLPIEGASQDDFIDSEASTIYAGGLVGKSMDYPERNARSEYTNVSANSPELYTKNYESSDINLDVTKHIYISDLYLAGLVAYMDYTRGLDGNLSFPPSVEKFSVISPWLEISTKLVEGEGYVSAQIDNMVMIGGAFGFVDGTISGILNGETELIENVKNLGIQAHGFSNNARYTDTKNTHVYDAYNFMPNDSEQTILIGGIAAQSGSEEKSNNGGISNVSINWIIEKPERYNKTNFVDIFGGVVGLNHNPLTNFISSLTGFGVSTPHFAGYFAGAVGVNSSEITDGHVTEFSNNVVTPDPGQRYGDYTDARYLAGFVGFNNGTILGSSVKEATFEIDTVYTNGKEDHKYENTSHYIAGFAAVNFGTISYSNVEGAKFGTIYSDPGKNRGIAQYAGFVQNNSNYINSSGETSDEAGVINNCYAVSEGYANRAAGFIYNGSGGSITECYSAGSIRTIKNLATDTLDGYGKGYTTVGVYVGGFAENPEHMTISDCYSNMKIVVENGSAGAGNANAIGGFIGSLSTGTTLTNCYSVSTVKNENGYDSVTITPSSSCYQEGLFIGKLNTGLNYVTNCYVVDEFGMHMPIIGKRVEGESFVAVSDDDLTSQITRDYLVNYLDGTRAFSDFAPLVGQKNGAWVLQGEHVGNNSGYIHHFPLLKAGSYQYKMGDDGIYGIINNEDGYRNICQNNSGQETGSRVNPEHLTADDDLNNERGYSSKNILVTTLTGEASEKEASEKKVFKVKNLSGYIAQVGGAKYKSQSTYGVDEGDIHCYHMTLETPSPEAVVTGINFATVNITGTSTSGVYTNIKLTQNISMFENNAQNVVLENVLYELNDTYDQDVRDIYGSNVNARGLIAPFVTSTGKSGATENILNNVNVLSTDSKCYMTGGWSYNGCFIGRVQANTKITNCSNAVDLKTLSDVDIDSRYSSFVSNNTGNVHFENCFNTGNIYTNKIHKTTYCGALVGANQGIVDADNCFNVGNFTYDVERNTSSIMIGGLVGWTNSDTTISNCINSGMISTISTMNVCIGGIVSKYHNSSPDIKIENCINIADLSSPYGSSNSIAPIIFPNTDHSNVTISNCYYAEDLITAEITNYNTFGAVATTTAELSTSFSFDNSKPTLAGITSANGFKYASENSVFPYLAFVDELPDSSGATVYKKTIDYDLIGTYLFPRAFDGSNYLTTTASDDASRYLKTAFASGQVTAIKTAYAKSGANNASNSSINVSNVTILGLGKTNYISNPMFESFSGRVYSVNIDINSNTSSNEEVDNAGLILNSSGEICINNCSVSGSIKSYKDAAGFVCDVMNNTIIRMSTNNAEINSVIANCHSSYGVAGFGGYVKNSATIQVIKCINRGTITSNSSSSGLIGASSSNETETISIYESVNQGTVTGYNVGGLVAYAPCQLNIANCYNVGSIISTKTLGQLTENYVGGLVGYAPNSKNTIMNCYNASIITNSNGGVDSTIGGVAGHLGGTRNYLYWIQDGALRTKNVEYSIANIGTGSGSKLGLYNMSSIFNYTNYEGRYSPWVYGLTDTSIETQEEALASIKTNATKKWVLWGHDGSTLPTLTMQYKNVDDSYHLVYNEDTLTKFAESDKTTALQVGVFKTSAEIGTLKADKDWTYDGNNYFVVNPGTGAKTGVFDRISGKNVTIKNLGAVSTIGSGNASATNYGGMIGANNGNPQIAVSSLTFDNCWVSVSGTHTGTGSFGGFVAPQASGTTYINCKAYGSVTSNAQYVGGFVGDVGASGTTFTYCENNMNITGKNSEGYAGGIAGYSNNTDIDNCVNNGSIISSKTPAGGLVGYQSNFTANWDYNTNNGDVTGVRAGGIVGHLVASGSSGAVRYCRSSNEATITASGARGSEAQAAGIVGVSENYLTVSNCVNNSTITSEFYSNISGFDNSNSNGTQFKKIAGIIGTHKGSTIWLGLCENNGGVTLGEGENGERENEDCQAAGLIAQAYNCNVTIRGCTNNGNITGGAHATAGFIGYVQRKDVEGAVEITDYYRVESGSNVWVPSAQYGDLSCISYSGSPNGTSQRIIGGLIGVTEQNVVIKKYSHQTTISPLTEPVVIGKTSSKVSITGGDVIGGIIAIISGRGIATIDASDFTLRNSNIESITSGAYMGGFVGTINESAKFIGKNLTNNLSLSKNNVSSNSYIGGFVGQTSGAVKLTNCSNVSTLGAYFKAPNPHTGNISYYYNCVGGLIGIVGSISGVNQQTSGSGNITIENCTNSANLGGDTVGDGYVAGLIGYCYTSGTVSITGSGNAGAINGFEIAGLLGRLISNAIGGLTLTNCTNSGSITAISFAGATYHVGGLIAMASGSGTAKIEDCSNSGTITGIKVTGVNSTVGGLVSSAGLGITFKECSNTASVSTGVYVGGFVGRSSNNLTFTDCNNGESGTSATISNGTHCGGFVGYADSGKVNIESSYNYMSVSATSSAGGFVGHITTNVEINGGTNQKAQNSGIITTTNYYSYAGGAIGYSESDSTIIIGFKNTANISANASNASVGGVIGCANAGVTIENCLISGILATPYGSESYCGGAVGYAGSGVLTIEDVIINGDSLIKGYYAGGIVGYAHSTNVSKITLNNCVVNGNIADKKPEVFNFYNYITDSGIWVTFALIEKERVVFECGDYGSINPDSLYEYQIQNIQTWLREFKNDYKESNIIESAGFLYKIEDEEEIWWYYNNRWYGIYASEYPVHYFLEEEEPTLDNVSTDAGAYIGNSESGGKITISDCSSNGAVVGKRVYR